MDRVKLKAIEVNEDYERLAKNKGEKEALRMALESIKIVDKIISGMTYESEAQGW